MAEKIPIRYENLKNKSFIITGGASGLGLATATLFAEHGAYVTIADYDEPSGRQVEAELGQKGLKISFVHCNVTDWSASVAAFKHAVNFSPRKALDGAFLYAGVGGDQGNLARYSEMTYPIPSLEEDPKEEGTRIIDINLNGQLISTKLALYYFRIPAIKVAPEDEVSLSKKTLFLVASLAGYVDYEPTHYCISKYGIRGLFRSLRVTARQLESSFCVNLVAPGFTPTPLTLKGRDEDGPRQQVIRFVTENNLWSPVEYTVQAAAICATNTVGDDAVNGRSFATWPHGLVDQKEDLENGYGGLDLKHHIDEGRYLTMGLLKG